jgi:hypothetical protein
MGSKTLTNYGLIMNATFCAASLKRASPQVRFGLLVFPFTKQVTKQARPRAEKNLRLVSGTKPGIVQLMKAIFRLK